MPVDQCPSKQSLSDFLFGRDDEVSADEVGEHVRSCAACQATLDECNAQQDTIVTTLKHGTGQPKFDTEPELLRALNQVCEMQTNRVSHQVDTVKTVATELTTLGGVRLGQYQLLELLGEGGMGTVYKAEHTRLEMVVAVKLLSDRLTNDPQAVARFDREMKAVGSVNHPNIVRATDAGEQHGRHYLAMEFIDGCDLHQLVHQLGRLRINDACEAIRQAALGIEHAHRLGLIHRDLKPSNLMLTRDGQVKVLDLGLARLRASKAGVCGGLTNDFQVMGTADYMPPEQALKATEVDHRVDIYSLGCTLYTLLCGKPPFSGAEYDEPLKKLIAHDRDEPTAVIQRRPEVPLELSTLIDKTLAKSPIDRLASAAELAEALRPFTEGADLAALVAKLPATHRPKGVTSDLAEHVAMTDTIASEPRSKAVRDAVGGRHRAWLVIAALLLGGVFAAALMLRFVKAYIEEPIAKSAVPSDRSVAEWAIHKNALVTLQNDRGKLIVDRTTELPEGDFLIDKIDFAEPCQFSDDELIGLAELTQLRDLAFQDPQISEQLVDHLRRLPTLSRLELRFAGVAPNGLHLVERLRNVTTFYLHGPRVEDADVEAASRLAGIVWLGLQCPHITNASLEHVGTMRQLQYLHLLQTPEISDAGMSQIKDLPNLTQLFALGASITDEGLQHIAAMKHLEWLNLGSTQISDDGLKQIAEMVSLRRLTITRTRTTNIGVANLRPLSDLQHLDLADTQITDAAVDDLAAFRQMKDLRVGDRLSADAVQSLRQRLPNCTVTATTSH